MATAAQPNKMGRHNLVKDKKPISASRFSRRLMNEFVSKSDLGLAIFDEQLRYQSVNPWLAARNGLAVELHIGKHLKDVVGELATQLEPALTTALISGQPVVNFEAGAPLPVKREGKRWIASFFPAKDAHGNVKQIAAIFVEAKIAKPQHGTAAQTVPNIELLRSWKEIAAYMGTCVKTVQRWEHTYGLPVRRVTSSKGSVVFALRSEVENWMRARSATKT